MCIEIVTADLPNFNITKYLITSLHPPVPIFAVLSTTVSALVEYDFEKKKLLTNFYFEISNKYVFFKCRLPVRIHGSLLLLSFFLHIGKCTYNAFVLFKILLLCRPKTGYRKKRISVFTTSD